MYIIAANFAIELTNVEVWDRMPAFFIIHSRLRKPLRHKISLVCMSQTGKYYWHLHPEWCTDLHFLSGSQRTWEIDTGNIRCTFTIEIINVVTINRKLKAIYVT